MAHCAHLPPVCVVNVAGRAPFKPLPAGLFFPKTWYANASNPTYSACNCRLPSRSFEAATAIPARLSDAKPSDARLIKNKTAVRSGNIMIFLDHNNNVARHKYNYVYLSDKLVLYELTVHESEQ
jgi:hypothetical protein